MKTLFVNGKFVAQPVTGVQRYATGVVSAWDDALEDREIDRSKYAIKLIVPKTENQIPQYRHIEVVRSISKGRTWEQLELPYRSRGNVLFSPYAAAPVFKSRHAVTIHDAGVAATPEQYSPTFGAFYRTVYRCLGKSCTILFTVSPFSKEELHKYFSIPLEKLIVVPPGCDYLGQVEPDHSILPRFGLVRGSFMLGVSSRSSIKNFDGLWNAWKMLDRPTLRLVIAGSSRRIFRSGAPEMDDRVAQLGYVSDAELRALYEAAAVFVYPSFYEGFGMPPVEAMQLGCPVLVARGSALPDTCGDGALYCDPSDAADIASKIAAILDDQALGQELKQKGKLRAQQFTMRATGARLWDEIEKIL